MRKFISAFRISLSAFLLFCFQLSAFSQNVTITVNGTTGAVNPILSPSGSGTYTGPIQFPNGISGTNGQPIILGTNGFVVLGISNSGGGSGKGITIDGGQIYSNGTGELTTIEINTGNIISDGITQLDNNFISTNGSGVMTFSGTNGGIGLPDGDLLTSGTAVGSGTYSGTLNVAGLSIGGVAYSTGSAGTILTTSSSISAGQLTGSGTLSTLSISTLKGIYSGSSLSLISGGGQSFFYIASGGVDTQFVSANGILPAQFYSGTSSYPLGASTLSSTSGTLIINGLVFTTSGTTPGQIITGSGASIFINGGTYSVPSGFGLMVADGTAQRTITGSATLAIPLSGTFAVAGATIGDWVEPAWLNAPPVGVIIGNKYVSASGSVVMVFMSTGTANFSTTGTLNITTGHQP